MELDSCRQEDGDHLAVQCNSSLHDVVTVAPHVLVEVGQGHVLPQDVVVDGAECVLGRHAECKHAEVSLWEVEVIRCW